MKTVVAVDPGVTSGIAIARVDSDGVVDVYRQLELAGDHHLELWVLLHDVQPSVVVCEEFTYRVVSSKGTKMPGIRLESKEYIGVCKLYAEKYHSQGVAIVMQPASIVNGKQVFWSPAKLRTVGLYNRPGGRDHINDATGHLLHYCMKMGWGKDLIRRLRDRPSSDPAGG